MHRLIALFALTIILPAAQAASLQEHELSVMLQQIARDSSVGTPRVINKDILDQGYTAEGNELVNYLSVRPAHAEQMRANPETMRRQLADSVCNNPGYQRLLSQGAVLRYQFSEYKSNRPVAVERFTKADCGLQ